MWTTTVDGNEKGIIVPVVFVDSFTLYYTLEPYSPLWSRVNEQ